MKDLISSCGVLFKFFLFNFITIKIDFIKTYNLNSIRKKKHYLSINSLFLLMYFLTKNIPLLAMLFIA